MNVRLVLPSLLFLVAAAAQTTRTVWDGVYTNEQAERGKKAYTDRCSTCHGGDLIGHDEAPGLVGDTFLSNWNTLTVDDLFDRTRVSMPADHPGTLSRKDVADILAYVFAANKFPAGTTELPTQSEVLKQIKFLAVKP
jgi:mono/diheme cytochrome c family protein